MVNQEVEASYTSFSNAQRVALLLIALGQKWATEILRLLKEEDVKKISFWISQMKYVPQEVTERVIKDFYERMVNQTSLASSGGKDYLYEVLVGLMGEAKARELVDELSSKDEHEVFRILQQVNPSFLAAHFKQERPQTVALMLAYLDAERAARIISALPELFQAEVLVCLAKMEETDPDVVAAMEGALIESLGGMAGDKQLAKMGGIKNVAEILNNMSQGADKAILEHITEDDFELATSIKDLMFVFSDVVLLDDKSIQTLMKDIEQADLIMALKGASPDIQDKIFKNVSKRQAEGIVDELSFMGPVKGSVVQASQQKIVNVIRKLDEEGKILIQGKGGGGDEIIS